VLLLMHRLSSSCLFRNARRVERTRPGVVRHAVDLAAHSTQFPSTSALLRSCVLTRWGGLARAQRTRG